MQFDSISDCVSDFSAGAIDRLSDLQAGRFEGSMLGEKMMAALSPSRGSERRCDRGKTAAGVLYPFFGILISPIWASAAMSLSSLSVVGNALRLRRARL